MTGHLLRGRIIPVYERGHHVANHGRVDCAFGWSSGEQVSLPQAQKIADKQHPEGIKKHSGY